MTRALILLMLLMPVAGLRAETPAKLGWCQRIVNKLFYRQEVREAKGWLAKYLGPDYVTQLRENDAHQLRYILPSRQAWQIVSPLINGAHKLDLSNNPHVSQAMLLDLLSRSASTLEALDLRGIKITWPVFEVIAQQMPNLRRLRIDHLPMFSLGLLGGHPALVELDIRKVKPYWFEIRNFIREMPPKLRFLKVHNYPDAAFLDDLRDFAQGLKRTLEVRAYHSEPFHAVNFRRNPSLKDVLDGDTFKTSIREFGAALGSEVSIRIRDLDAPEMKPKNNDPYEKKMARAARMYLFERLAGKRVTLDNLEAADKYPRRYVADLLIEGQPVFHDMIRLGLAVYYPFHLDSKKPQPNWRAIYETNPKFYDDLAEREAQFK